MCQGDHQLLMASDGSVVGRATGGGGGGWCAARCALAVRTQCHTHVALLRKPLVAAGLCHSWRRQNRGCHVQYMDAAPAIHVYTQANANMMPFCSKTPSYCVAPQCVPHWQCPARTHTHTHCGTHTHTHPHTLYAPAPTHTTMYVWLRQAAIVQEVQRISSQAAQERDLKVIEDSLVAEAKKASAAAAMAMASAATTDEAAALQRALHASEQELLAKQREAIAKAEQDALNAAIEVRALYVCVGCAPGVVSRVSHAY